MESSETTDSATLSTTAIVVVNYGSHALLESNLRAVSEDASEATCIVVDNFTSADEQRRVADLCEANGWMFVPLDHNTGFGNGVNAGVAAAAERGLMTFVVLNPDATIGRNSLIRLATAAAADHSLMVAPVIYRSDGRVWFSGTDVYLDDGRMRNPRRRGELSGRPYREWLTGACFAISNELWLKVGGYDDDYFLYWEDVDLSYRVQQTGGHVEVDREATAVHDAGGTHTEKRRGRAKSETYYYYNIRNRLVYAAKNVDSTELRKWLRATPRVSYEILLQGGRAQFAHPVVPLRAFIRGIRDGRKFVRASRRRN